MRRSTNSWRWDARPWNAGWSWPAVATSRPGCPARTEFVVTGAGTWLDRLDARPTSAC